MKHGVQADEDLVHSNLPVSTLIPRVTELLLVDHFVLSPLYHRSSTIVRTYGAIALEPINLRGEKGQARHWNDRERPGRNPFDRSAGTSSKNEQVPTVSNHERSPHRERFPLPLYVKIARTLERSSLSPSGQGGPGQCCHYVHSWSWGGERSGCRSVNGD